MWGKFGYFLGVLLGTILLLIYSELCGCVFVQVFHLPFSDCLGAELDFYINEIYIFFRHPVSWKRKWHREFQKSFRYHKISHLLILTRIDQVKYIQFLANSFNETINTVIWNLVFKLPEKNISFSLKLKILLSNYMNLQVRWFSMLSLSTTWSTAILFAEQRMFDWTRLWEIWILHMAGGALIVITKSQKMTWQV